MNNNNNNNESVIKNGGGKNLPLSMGKRNRPNPYNLSRVPDERREREVKFGEITLQGENHISPFQVIF